MAQARVTDYFSQSKKAGTDRSLRSKSQKTRTAAEQRVVSEVKSVKSRSSRSSRAASTQQQSAQLQAVQEEFLRVIDEAVSAPPDHVDQEELDPVQQSPRTPKRTSAEAEFDLGSTVFASATELHSTAKKRLRVAKEEAAAAATKKTARKKLVLSKHGETEKALATTPTREDSNNVVEQGAHGSPLNKKQFSREDVATLKARLQKLKGQAESTTSPKPAPVSAVAELQSRLDSARELAVEVQQRKEERLSELEKTSEEQKRDLHKADEGTNLPAYRRYHTLAQDVPPGLTLPYKYKVLAEMFRSMDTIVGMLFNRLETVTFAKVKQGVQDMMHKRFEETHVGQIKTVYPTAYTFRQEKNVPTFSATVKRSTHQLTVEPIAEGTNEARPTLSATRLLERRRVFHQNLVEIVKGHHKVFLATLNPPVVVPDDKLTRWHPRFNVDEVPDVRPGHLPRPPQTERPTTARELLDRARTLMTPKMEKALANMALKTAEAARSKEADPPGKPPQQTSSALEGVSQSLLERIRAKEAQKLQAAMTRDPKREERLSMMSHLPEMARILRNVFVAEKKPALTMELACNRMTRSYRSSLGAGEMEKQLRLLADSVPEWLTLHPIRKDVYLKLNKNTNVSLVLEELNRKIKEEERC
ncbi:DNA replication factor Cdt1 isoform X2 [Trichomycterus rosablanca]|uniref:DNA replication factor Cdt1 isoform X2 n=1 Tax=Trichomycterus rosablanca TaxID=2290929 RepID=UPI002F34FC68